MYHCKSKYKNKVVTDNTAGNVKFYIDGVLVATHTTNIPIIALPYRNTIEKTAGTTARILSLDYLQFTQLF